ncbi:endonuclease/exonuclease/phosphatase family protein [Aspergillus clavatus NRRL 1]|uniref:Endonuclease/exonuclease/phosphatase family protein n=1 Tax=Aspergillus clavatus (strain ATCC 1007 / CBS 513.65 / DSM 816 / NCTC 3887 / NRRL 1 / QM 1276 / 107) TaxID=344612 RepID=A1CK34_ASPCL|nr:endonuclease/exonuclease/phosphatase family protein [Aspergillus clavatus NRRL 1]EAW09508.1 endonuclease/exonuclease/phosphatase family protein [Aspergillus clavatus NRRL 1]
MKSILSVCAAALLLNPTLAVTIAQLNGNKYLSPYDGQTVSRIHGLVTAIGSTGFYLRSTTPDTDAATSGSIYVYSSTAAAKVSVGDIVSLSGKVTEYRSSSAYVYLTELSSPSALRVTSSGNPVTPVVVGKGGLMPPTEQFSSLDGGDVLGLPNDASQISNVNPVLQPSSFGMDFWESLSGELVTVTGLRAVGKPNSYGDTGVVGDWKTTGGNERGGLTMRAKDSNPEAIVIGSPLDGSTNPTDTKLGDTLEDITGVVTQGFGSYRILPLTALSVTGSNSTSAAATNLVSDGTCSAVTFGSYNIDNFSSTSATLPKVAQHIAQYLKSPTIVFLQEIQDDDGPTDDGVVSANQTLASLAQSIADQGGINYNFVDINPIDDQDGGQPGGNIRVAYLYDPSVVRLHNPNPGSSTDANEVLPGAELKYNPGRIAPADAAWDHCRKPLAAAWETLDGKNKFFTINVHFTSKLGGSPIEGDARPPVNGDVSTRAAQAEVVAAFTSSILAQDSKAKILTAGDFNEFAFAQPLESFVADSGLQDLDVVAGVASTERYTYLYDLNCQQLDHMFISPALAAGAKMHHLHLNTWVSSSDQASDHDPTVALLNVCE